MVIEAVGGQAFPVAVTRRVALGRPWGIGIAGTLAAGADPANQASARRTVAVRGRLGWCTGELRIGGVSAAQGLGHELDQEGVEDPGIFDMRRMTQMIENLQPRVRDQAGDQF